jgi:hypothetical protein
LGELVNEFKSKLIIQDELVFFDPLGKLFSELKSKLRQIFSGNLTPSGKLVNELKFKSRQIFSGNLTPSGKLVNEFKSK